MSRIVTSPEPAAGTVDPDWFFTPGSPYAIITAGALGANTLYVMRCMAFKTGTVTSLSAGINVSSGNMLAGIASVASETLTITSLASQAVPTGGQWRELGNPNFAVTKGQIVYLCVMFSNGTAQIFLPANTVVGGYPLIGVTGLNPFMSSVQGSFVMPATIALSSMTEVATIPAMGAKIT